jgi:hypothetical protein
MELKNTYFLTLGGRGYFLLKLLVDAADLSRPFAAFLLSAVSILNTIFYKIRSKSQIWWLTVDFYRLCIFLL